MTNLFNTEEYGRNVYPFSGDFDQYEFVFSDDVEIVKSNLDAQALKFLIEKYMNVVVVIVDEPREDERDLMFGVSFYNKYGG